MENLHCSKLPGFPLALSYWDLFHLFLSAEQRLCLALIVSVISWGVGEGRWVGSAFSLVKIFWELQMVLLQIAPNRLTTFDRKGNRPFPPSFLKTYVQYSKLLTYMKPVGFFKCFVSFYKTCCWSLQFFAGLNMV